MIKRLVLLVLITLMSMGCTRGMAPKPPVCTKNAENTVTPPGALQIGLRFLEALYTYDTKRLQELSTPDIRSSIVHEAFNGPNALKVKWLEQPRLIEVETCDVGVRLAYQMQVQYPDYQAVHTIWLAMQPQDRTWLVKGMSGEFNGKVQ